jgi:hypothetical protein
MNVADSMDPELYGSKLSIGFSTEIKSNHSLTTSNKTGIFLERFGNIWLSRYAGKDIIEI